MKKILIGTHNDGKFKEIAYLIGKNYKKISPLNLNIRSPKETGKTFKSNSKLKNKKNRSAFFVCSLSFKSQNGKVTTVEGKIYGKISKKIIGKKGFGYDPIFIPKTSEITFGQMAKSKKIKSDHRYVAFKKLKKKIKTL